ncbi:hypothetical protein C0674_09260 [Sporolactobacillus terrae]|uniref:Uncharacterized protein n=1 Tax=Sporolactobacillus terrae TaxID=269673 RepID=A0ABX5Q845_9BACL|nr:hypothetical protein C0674_09260 [Sporolactobacillus terrae]QAA25773.1 hypothetical protein C0679_09240 [Sporolactobacillus terrae]
MCIFKNLRTSLNVLSYSRFCAKMIRFSQRYVKVMKNSALKEKFLNWVIGKRIFFCENKKDDPNK